MRENFEIILTEFLLNDVQFYWSTDNLRNVTIFFLICRWKRINKRQFHL